MRSKYVIYILLILVLVQTYSIYNLYQTNKAVAQNLNIQGNKYTRIIGLDYIASIKTDGYAIPGGIILHTAYKQSVSLDSLLSSGKKLVVRYPITACQACIEQQIPLINDLAEKIGYENIIFISPYTSGRYIEIIQKKHSLKFEIYLNTELGTPIEELSETLMFISDNNKIVSHAFVPRKEFPVFLEKYFHFIQGFFEKNIS